MSKASMDSLFWCSDCRQLYGKENATHNGHNTTQLGQDEGTTILALDEIIQFGLDALKNEEQSVENAKVVKEDINEQKEKFVVSSKARIERIVDDLRVAMEDCTAQNLKEVNKKVGDMELRCQSVITTSRVKIDTVKNFVQQAAITLPDDDGNLHPTQLAGLYNHFRYLSNIQAQPRPRIKPVDVNVKYPNSYQRKKKCNELAAFCCGAVDNPQRNSFLHMDDTDFVPAIDIRNRPNRQMSRDMLNN